MTTTDPETRFAVMAADRVVERIQGVAHSLRRIADEVERSAPQRRNAVDAPPDSWRVNEVVHTVMWGLANLNLDGLLLNAAESDRLRESVAVGGLQYQNQNGERVVDPQEAKPK